MKLLRLYMICLLIGFLFFGCLGTQTQQKSIEEEKNVSDITTGITNETSGVEVEEIIIPEINESEGEFPLPV